jgi:hypothetical protein
MAYRYYRISTHVWKRHIIERGSDALDFRDEPFGHDVGQVRELLSDVRASQEISKFGNRLWACHE